MWMSRFARILCTGCVGPFPMMRYLDCTGYRMYYRSGMGLFVAARRGPPPCTHHRLRHRLVVWQGREPDSFQQPGHHYNPHLRSPERFTRSSCRPEAAVAEPFDRRPNACSCMTNHAHSVMLCHQEAIPVAVFFINRGTYSRHTSQLSTHRVHVSGSEPARDQV